MKLYNEKEIGTILKKAAENSHGDGSQTSVGLTIGELQQLASDAGIDPEEIARAIAEIDSESESTARTFLGGPFSFNSRIVLDKEITASDWEDMLVSIRECMKAKGDVSTRESATEWSSPWGTTNSAQVTATKNDGKTKVSVSWNGPLTALPFYLPVPPIAIASLFFASEFLELSAIPGVSFVVLMSGLSFLAGRWALRRHLGKVFASLRRMTAEFERVFSKDVATSEAASDRGGQIKSQTDPARSLLDIEVPDGDGKSANRDRSRA